MTWLLLYGLSAMSGFFYRLGGRKWTKARDFGCPALACVWLTYHFGLTWLLIPFFGLSFAGMTTYHKWLNPLFGDTKEDVHWYGWAMHGFALGCAGFALTHFWFGNMLRTTFLAIGMCLWSECINNDTLEEWGRGVLFLASLQLIKLSF